MLDVNSGIASKLLAHGGGVGFLTTSYYIETMLRGFGVLFSDLSMVALGKHYRTLLLGYVALLMHQVLLYFCIIQTA